MADWQIVCDEVKHWARSYSGPKFHAILTDPPYHLYSINKRFGQDGSAPAKFGQDGAFVRASAGFMGQKWDGGEVAFDPETWHLLARHLHPGGFIISFASGRGYHRVMVAMEDAGLEMHHNLFLWAQGQGFTKATRIDRHFQVLRHGWDGKGMNPYHPAISNDMMGREAMGRRLELLRKERAFQGHRYGQQTLAPKVEPIILAQRPYESDAMLYDIIETGAGCLNVDGCRLGGSWKWGTQTDIRGGGYGSRRPSNGDIHATDVESHPSGRWPSNFILCHTPDCKKIRQTQIRNTSGSIKGNEPDALTKNVYGRYNGRRAFDKYGENGYETVDSWDCVPECPVRMLGKMSGERSTSHIDKPCDPEIRGYRWGTLQGDRGARGYDDKGTAARFYFQTDWSLDIAEKLADVETVYYVPKVSSPKERNAGLDGYPDRVRNRVNPGGLENESRWAPTIQKNDHPTLKPITLTKYLTTLLLPPEMYVPRRILIPFAGVMSEGIGALLAGWDEILAIEQDSDYCQIGDARMTWWADRYRWGLSEVDAILATAKKDETPEGCEQLVMF